MSKSTSRFWDWLFNRSPQNAAKPQVQSRPSEQNAQANEHANGQPIETYLEADELIASLIRLGFEETALRAPDGQLVRVNSKKELQIGCGHIVSQFQAVNQHDRHIRGIAGKCFYCGLELQGLFEKGEVTVFDAQRLSLVCDQCAQIVVSGHLCCPKHYTPLPNPDGSTTYLGPEDAKQQERQTTTTRIIQSVALLFGQDMQEESEQGPEKQNHD